MPDRQPFPAVPGAFNRRVFDRAQHMRCAAALNFDEGVPASAAFGMQQPLADLTIAVLGDEDVRHHPQRKPHMKPHPILVKSRGMPRPRLSGQRERIRAEERAQLAQDLHDELGALLMAAKLNVAGLWARCSPLGAEVQSRLQKLTDLLDDGLALKNRVVDGLHPSDLLHSGLVSALEHLAQDFQNRTEIATHARLEDVSLDKGAQLGVYRLVQECLTNIGKHARATHVTIELQDEPGQTVVAISDDGIGFDHAGTASCSHGLTGMRRRIETTGGHFALESVPGAGTRVMAVLPKPIAARARPAKRPLASPRCVR